MFWNQSLDGKSIVIAIYTPLCLLFIGGYGDWSSDGCNTSSDSGLQVICNCDHLTNFAILLVNMHTYFCMTHTCTMYRMCLLILNRQRGQD